MSADHKCGIHLYDNSQYCYLHKAIDFNNRDVVNAILETRHNCVNATLQDGRSALYAAAFHKCLEIVQTLVWHGANINARDSFDNTPLLLAAGSSDIELLTFLIDHGADTCCENRAGTNICHRLAQFSNVSTAQRLFGLYGDIQYQLLNRADHCGQIPLHYAAMLGHLELVSFFINCGANPNYRNAMDQTPLHVAAIWGKVEIIEALIHFEVADVKANSCGITWTAWQYFEQNFPDHQDKEKVKQLLCPQKIYMPNFEQSVLTCK